ncbi:hypothetical protein [Cryobacterium tagatosivorans]|uniref:Uncharacterized protein n=1 Tax=Cryobacterium tagatosivorans TaxID=1259199 RepID=A0A4R8UFT7_9MICO|nr:hypothetical protein [Cryobacterium tagatosivorans]TFB51060.1 hypothetical protein E3O23_09000 [Cryobacterium tagatosivorans]
MSALSEFGRDERIARIALSIIATPNDPLTGQLLRHVGVTEALRLAYSEDDVSGMDRIESRLKTTKPRCNLPFHQGFSVGLTGFEPATHLENPHLFRASPVVSENSLIPLCLQGTKRFAASECTRVGPVRKD